MRLIGYIVCGLFGLIIGSFLNVCIYRIPRKESISHPRSHCGNCNKNLGVLDLIPILSYMFLGGKCRYCKEKISIRYPLIELINALLYVMIYHYFQGNIVVISYSILLSILLTISVIDYETMLIPNKIIIFGVVAGLIHLIISSVYYKDIHIILGGIYGLLTGGLIIGGIILLSLVLFKKEGMGFGDLKLLAMIGLFVGAKHTIFTIFIASILGGVVAVVLLLKKKDNIIPFGPFISIGAVIAITWGDKIWNWYFNYMIR